MKKRCFILQFVFILICGTTNAQIENSKWAGTLMIPNETECIFQFKKDSLYLYLADGEREIEAMRYAVSNDSLKIVKLHGSSPCDTSTEAVYLWKIKDNILKLTAFKDDCDARTNALHEVELNKIKAEE
ncbi:MAG TPA: hypothetical protein PK504_11625 [Ferruginibacter sp.]|nr:hypothetical protein [Ferruginibacter sp.]HRE63808.1 hypothetical protein [Ferruginibacter sp.]